MSRFLGRRDSYSCSQIDLDSVEFCRWCSEPLVLIETKRWGAQELTYTVTQNLADLAQLPAYLVEYRPCKGDVWFHSDEGWLDIDRFRVRSRYMTPVEMSPTEYASWVLGLRSAHLCPLRKSGAA